MDFIYLIQDLLDTNLLWVNGGKPRLQAEETNDDKKEIETNLTEESNNTGVEITVDKVEELQAKSDGVALSDVEIKPEMTDYEIEILRAKHISLIKTIPPLKDGILTTSTKNLGFHYGEYDSTDPNLWKEYAKEDKVSSKGMVYTHIASVFCNEEDSTKLTVFSLLRNKPCHSIRNL